LAAAAVAFLPIDAAAEPPPSGDGIGASQADSAAAAPLDASAV